MMKQGEDMKQGDWNMPRGRLTEVAGLVDKAGDTTHETRTDMVTPTTHTAPLPNPHAHAEFFFL